MTIEHKLAWALRAAAEDAQRVLNFLIASALIDKSKTPSVTEHMWMGE